VENQPVGISNPRVPPNTSDQTPTLNTTQELKKAENQGEHISISEEQIVRAIEKAVKAMQGTATELDFSVHKATNQIMVKVLERDTGRVIREIPPEKMLDFVAKLWEMAGILVDEKR
jgi:flagellar protein FlaG